MRSEGVVRVRIRVITSVGLAFGLMIVVGEVLAMATGHVR